MSRFLIVLALAATFLAIACDRGGSSSTPTPSNAENAVVGPAIYPLRLSLRDEDGHAASLDRFRGHPVILSMFYASCPSACPLTMSRIQSIERALPTLDRENLRVLLVSFDAERDTPAVLRKTALAHSLDSRWMLASASAEDARTLAAALGVTYTKLPDGEFSHSSVLVLVDEQGQPLARVEGIESDVSPIVLALTKTHRS